MIVRTGLRQALDFPKHHLTTDEKRIAGHAGLLRKVFICGTEWIVFFFYQIFKRDFPLAAAPYAPGCVYGSVANNSLAKGIVCMPDMFLILFVFGHGKSPFLNNGRGRQHLVLSPS